MSSRIIPVQPFDYVVFGATGDLTKRKLIPALYHRFLDGQFDEQSRIIGVSRTKWSDADFQKVARELRRRVRGEGVPGQEDHRPLRVDLLLCRQRCDRFQPSGAICPRSCATIPRWSAPSISPSRPDLFGPTCEYISKQEYYRRDARVVIEKPIGHDLESSEQINDEVGEDLPGRPDLPHRPLSRQGDGAEPDGAALCQHAVRAAVEFRPYRPRADHRGRDGRRWKTAPAITTRPARCATWCRTTCCSCSASWPWSRRRRWTPTRCATRS